MKLAYIVGNYPSLTTTFIEREIRTLRAWHEEVDVISLRRPRGSLFPAAPETQPQVIYLLPISPVSIGWSHLRFAVQRPAAYFGCLLYLLTRPHPSLKALWMTFLHFSEGVCVAHRLSHRSYEHIHAHFMDRAATVALVASRLLRIRYSFTAHAGDIYVAPVLAREKLSNAAFVATCTAYNRAHLAEIAADDPEHKIKCIYHGLDIENYEPARHAARPRPILLCVAQLKEKKGISYLLKACRALRDAGYEFQCRIVGEGPLQEALEAEIRVLKLEDVVTLCGALPHDQVIQQYAQADIFVLASVVGANGDRDGIPNVILEAMAMALPVVSTRHSSIPEVVEDQVNGLLVPPGDAGALEQAIRGLLAQPDMGRKLGEQGRRIVAEKFDLESNVHQLLMEFRSVLVEGKSHG